jgi:V/A-type H+-transporting ATPase subunit C|tara:strand:- start:257 stop:1270 length:1014 start_codon:yes stop_codon:yes gene_type:complete
MSNYAYVATRARSRRSRLLPAEAYNQLLNLEHAEIARYIQDLEYRREIDRYGSTLSGADLIETALVDNLAKDVGDFLSFSKGTLRDILQVYAEKYRVDNLKNIIRGINQNMDKENLERLVCPINDSDKDLYSKLYDSKTVDDVVSYLEGTNYYNPLKKALEARNSDSLQPLEDALDLIYYKNLVSNQPSGGADVEVYRNFIHLKVDIANIKTLLRMRHRGIGAHNELLINGGTVSVDMLSSTQTLEDLLTSLEGTKYYDLLEPHLKSDSVDLNSCVHSLDEYMANKTKRFSYLYPLSVLPVLDYLLKKEREVYNLRAIVRGKQAGLANELIEELVVV